MPSKSDTRNRIYLVTVHTSKISVVDHRDCDRRVEFRPDASDTALVALVGRGAPVAARPNFYDHRSKTAYCVGESEA
ncbi:hypothetical protein C480_03524 [Natrialba aegyptia DSM 13077]|uniref:Uncharacterized protein n=1 Tax=Natrialba aegyptia DSM 13077 TaxID=1227491 RepID=M0BBN8_9EURY|nr:hypothetical protein C480_03524 [Natrialba aegyptia DSM 13077]